MYFKLSIRRNYLNFWVEGVSCLMECLDLPSRMIPICLHHHQQHQQIWNQLGRLCSPSFRFLHHHWSHFQKLNHHHLHLRLKHHHRHLLHHLIVELLGYLPLLEILHLIDQPHQLHHHLFPTFKDQLGHHQRVIKLICMGF